MGKTIEMTGRVDLIRSRPIAKGFGQHCNPLKGGDGFFRAFSDISLDLTKRANGNAGRMVYITPLSSCTPVTRLQSSLILIAKLISKS